MRTHYCGEVSESLSGVTIEVAGWVHRRRDHGGVIFVDLRDRAGLLQVVFDPDTPEAFGLAEHLGREFCIQVRGRVRPRPAGTANSQLASGQVELLALELVVLNPSATPPFTLDEEANEELRLRYRYPDLRRELMQKRLRQRHAITRAMRVPRRPRLRGHRDTDADQGDPRARATTRASSRTHPGKFFALPQSPQIFTAADDERLRPFTRSCAASATGPAADRQPEFTQLDIETTRAGRVMALMEGPVRQVFRRVLAEELPELFPRLSYAEALRRYGSDNRPARAEFADIGDPCAIPSSRCSRHRLPIRRGASRYARPAAPAPADRRVHGLRRPPWRASRPGEGQ